MRAYAIVVFASLALALFIGALLAAQADTSSKAAGDQPRMVNLELKDVPIKDAIDSLFRGAGLKYELDPGVTGRVVELKLKGVTFEQGLKALGQAAGFTYKVVDGVYKITPAPSGTGCETTTVQQGQASPPQGVKQPGPAGAGPAPTTGPQAQPPLQQPASPNQQVTVSQSQNAPVFYGQTGGGPCGGGYGAYGGYGGCGGYGGYGGYGGCGYPPIYQYGNVGFISPWAPVRIGGGGSLMTRVNMPPPPPGYVSPDVQRFLQWRYATQSFYTFVPIP